ncbi:MAG TPA: hypothetical protein VEA37_13045 [Flavobacterium sp.]|nr:hypothetical protein [Flavobacterium sp.]
MQDLINEEEFIAKKSDYNPWRRFGVFYGIAFVVVIVLCLIMIYAEFGNPDKDIFIGITVLGPPVILPFIMIFHTRKNQYLPYKIIILAILGLMQAYLIGIFVAALYNKRTAVFAVEGLLAFGLLEALYIGLTILCFIIMYPILRYKRKRFK